MDLKRKRTTDSESSSDNGKKQKSYDVFRNVSVLKEYLTTGEFSDYKIVVNSGIRVRTFNVHKLILVQNSFYFQKVCSTSGAFKENKECKSEFPDREAGMMERVLKYLYGGGIGISTIKDGIKLLEYAEYFIIPTLKSKLSALIYSQLDSKKLWLMTNAETKDYILDVFHVFCEMGDERVRTKLQNILHYFRNRRDLARLLKEEEVKNFLSKQLELSNFIMIVLAEPTT